MRYYYCVLIPEANESMAKATIFHNMSNLMPLS